MGGTDNTSSLRLVLVNERVQSVSGLRVLFASQNMRERICSQRILQLSAVIDKCTFSLSRWRRRDANGRL
jgi:hypothetical protein